MSYKTSQRVKKQLKPKYSNQGNLTILCFSPYSFVFIVRPLIVHNDIFLSLKKYRDHANITTFLYVVHYVKLSLLLNLYNIYHCKYLKSIPQFPITTPLPHQNKSPEQKKQGQTAN